MERCVTEFANYVLDCVALTQGVDARVSGKYSNQIGDILTDCDKGFISEIEAVYLISQLYLGY